MYYAEQKGVQEPTPRQIEVLKVYSTGLSYEGVARRLGIARSTVKEHLGSLRERLGVPTSLSAFRMCIEEGWIDL